MNHVLQNINYILTLKSPAKKQLKMSSAEKRLKTYLPHKDLRLGYVLPTSVNDRVNLQFQ